MIINNLIIIDIDNSITILTVTNTYSNSIDSNNIT